MKLVTIDPRRIELADYGVLHLSPRPGTNAAVMLGIAHVIHRDGLVDARLHRARAPSGYDALLELLPQYTPEAVEEITGVPAADLERGRAHLRRGRRTPASLGPRRDRAQVRLRGRAADLQPRADDRQGRPRRRGAAAAARPEQRPGLVATWARCRTRSPRTARSATRRSRARSRSAWGVDDPAREGLTIPQMFDAAVAGDLKAMYIFGEDVAQTDPNTAHVVAALENLEFLVCQDIFETETTKYADVILPASSFLEKDGTFTNAERRDPARRRRRSSRPASAQDRLRDHHDDLDARSATSWAGDGPRTRCDEIAALTPHFAGVTYERLGRSGPAVAGRARRHRLADPLRARVRHARRHARTSPRCPTRRRATPPSEEFPLILVTGRRLQHYNAGTMTRRTGNLELNDRDYLEIHPDDAERLWITDGDTISVRSRAGPDRDHRPGHRPDRARARLHHVPLPGDADEPADRQLAPTSTRRARSTR